MPNDDAYPPIEHAVWGPRDEQIRHHVAQIRRQLDDGRLPVMAISPTETDFGFCHTVGLTDQGHPELVLATDCAPAMFVLEAMADWVRDAPTNRVTVPRWAWTDPFGAPHIYDVRLFGSDPHDPALIIVDALYGDDVPHSALIIDILSCLCALCADKVIVDTDGTYLRDA